MRTIKYAPLTHSAKLRTWLKQHGWSGRTLHKVRHAGGKLVVTLPDGTQADGTKIDVVPKAAQVAITLPPEQFAAHWQESFVPINILYEDDDYLVVNKPAWLTSVPSPLYPGDDLLMRVAGYFVVRSYRGQIPHIITRLDRDTSGCVLIAKHAFAHRMLADTTQITKKYWAWLTGTVQHNHFTVSLPLERVAGSLVKRQVAQQTAGKWALSRFERLEPGANWYQVAIKTGRTHQIRVHAAAVGHPLVGDDLYGTKDARLHRQALHCRSLQFIQPITHQPVSVTAPLPEELAQFYRK